MRRIGRDERLASPTRRTPKRCADTSPASRRMVVPELPQSSEAFGIFRP
jgi:hypothetical protein